MTGATWGLLLFCLGMMALHIWLLWEQMCAFRELVDTLKRMLDERERSQDAQEEVREALADLMEMLR